MRWGGVVPSAHARGPDGTPACIGRAAVCLWAASGLAPGPLMLGAGLDASSSTARTEAGAVKDRGGGVRKYAAVGSGRAARADDLHEGGVRAGAVAAA